MLSVFINFLKDDEDKNPSFIQMTRNILFFVIAVNLALLPLVIGLFGSESRNIVALGALSVTLLLEVISLALVYRGKIGMAKIIVPLALLTAVTIIAITTNGLRDISFVGLPIVLLIAVLLMGKKAVWIITPLAVLAAEIVATIDINTGRAVTKTGVDDAIIIAVLLIGCSAIIQTLVSRLNESLEKARENEQLQIIENRELNELRQSLEERVNQRTADLEKTTQYHTRRTRQFEAISQVTRVITAIQDPDTLLPYVTQVISEQFSVYHTGIFLLDKEREFAVLRAANSDGGKRMLARGHKLRVGQIGIVGFVTATGQPRIALNVGADATYFNNPDLPNTRSEIALPLRYAGEIIGALDVQSTEPNAFRQDDIEVLITLADQVSATIKNTLTLEEIRGEIAEYQRTGAESARESWKVMRPKSLGLGFQFIEAKIQPLEKPLEGEHIQDAIAQNRTILYNPENAASTLAIPIRLRGNIVGVINLRANNNYKLTNDDMEIIEAVTERLSLAMETASLLQATRHRADVERVTTDISSKISSSSRFETILQTAAQELSRALGGSDVLVQIEPVSIELGMNG